MKDWKKELLPWAGLLPVGVLAICVVAALSGYEPPVFEAEAVEETVAEISTEAPVKEVMATTQQDAVVETLVSEPEAKAYKDGTYYGNAQGFAGTMTVQVVIKEGEIAEIVLTETKDDKSYVDRASSLLSLMVEKQSTQVDAVSGATYSSVGLINAVRNALSQAASEGTTVEPEQTLPPATTNTKPDADAQKTVKTVEEDSTYKDGTYTGTGTGFGGTLKVKVTIKNGKIKTIKIVETSDDKEYIEAASALLKNIIKKQSTNVDTVSGATYSSVGLINAVRDALDKAAVTKTDKDTTTSEAEDTIPKGKFPYNDGIYYGTGVGFRGDITVAVVIKDKTLLYATVTDSVDDEAFLVKAETILDKMVQKQKTKVDVISGATYSSNGILEAVRNAMKEAKRVTKGTDQKTTDKEDDGQETASTDSESATETTEPSAQPSEQQTESGAPSADSSVATAAPSTDSGTATEAPGTDASVPAATPSPAPSNTENAPAQDTSGTAGTGTTPTAPAAPAATEAPSTVYVDGTYTGTAVCYPDDDEEFDSYTLSLQITISNDVITSITNIKGSGTNYDSLNDSFITLAANGTAKKKGAVAQMVNKGAPSKVDAVSGATCSSDAIFKAVKNAMASAKRK